MTQGHLIKNKKVIAMSMMIPLAAALNGYLSIIALLALFFLTTKLMPKKVLQVLVCYIFVQNLTLFTFANHFDSNNTRIFLLIKEAVLWMVVLFELYKNEWHKKLLKMDLLIVCYVLYMTCVLIIPSASFMARLISYRQFMTPVMCYLFGRVVKVTPKDYSQIMSVFVSMSIATAVIGLFEMTVLHDKAWLALPMQRYNLNKGTDFEFYRGVPLAFYSWDLIFIFGQPVKRLVSIFADSLQTAHVVFCAFLCVYLDIVKTTSKRRCILLILGATCILTISKGIILYFLIFMAIVLLFKFKNDSKMLLILMLVILLPIVVVILYQYLYFYQMDSSAFVHISALVNTFDKISFMGDGFGIAGSITSRVSGIEASVGADNFFAALLYQSGLIGGILYIALWGAIVIYMFSFLKRNKNNFVFLGFILLMCAFTESFLSESSTAFVSTGIYFITGGIVVSYIKNIKNNHFRYR